MKDDSDGDKKQQIHHIQNLYAFNLFCQKRFDDSMQVFAKLGTGRTSANPQGHLSFCFLTNSSAICAYSWDVLKIFCPLGWRHLNFPSIFFFCSCCLLCILMEEFYTHDHCMLLLHLCLYKSLLSCDSCSNGLLISVFKTLCYKHITQNIVSFNQSRRR